MDTETSGTSPHNRRRIIFRCDANEKVGFGHLSRCLAWAEALDDCRVPVGVLGAFHDDAANLMAAAGIPPVRDSADARAVVIDGYHFSDDEMSGTTPRIWVDDFADRARYAAHAVVNFTVRAPELKYPGGIAHRFLGPAYFPARRALRALRADAPPAGQHILIAVGGYDRSNLTARLCRAVLSRHPDASLRVAMGSQFRHRADLDELARHHAIEVMGFQPDNAALYRGVGLCLCGGGLTKYEAAYLGIPAGVVSQTPAQQSETDAFAAAGLCANLGLAAQIDDRTLVDGVADFLAAAPLHERLRRAGQHAIPEDCALRFARDLVASLS